MTSKIKRMKAKKKKELLIGLLLGQAMIATAGEAT